MIERLNRVRHLLLRIFLSRPVWVTLAIMNLAIWPVAIVAMGYFLVVIGILTYALFTTDIETESYLILSATMFVPFLFVLGVLIWSWRKLPPPALIRSIFRR